MEEVVLKDTLNAHWKQNVKSSFGFRMMQKMGWSEEKGLGKEENGITNYVKISKREDGLGLGMDEFQDDNVGSKAWGSTVSAYNSVLEVLKASYKPNPINNNSTSSDESSSDNDEKTKKKSKKEKKRQRKEDKQSDDDEDAVTPKSSSTPIKSVGIKYKKFRESKLLANKSFEDKKAIFGHSSFASLPSIQSNNSLTSMASLQTSSSEGKEKVEQNDDEEKKSEKKSKKEKKNKKRKRSEKEEEE